MAMSLGGSSVKSDINVTPLVDVVLVLLIIFMVVTPLLQKGFDMEIPQETKAEIIPDPNKLQLILTVRGDSRMFLNKTEVQRQNLGDEISKAITGHKDKVMFIQADGGLDYGYVVSLMDICRVAGIENVALITKENLNLDETVPGP
jgi:biopolymer transport protein ExbD